jgi:glycyl-tRNA synthetase beta chain
LIKGIDLVLEVGTEELPPGEIAPALLQLADGTRKLLEVLRLPAGEISVFGTPRRLVTHVAGLIPRQRAAVREVRGPAAQAAYDREGKPTQAAAGFARSQGVPVERLKVIETAGRRYVAAVIEEGGRPAAAVLPDAVTALVEGLSFSKTMRWGESDARFARPVRWVLALLGTQALPVRIAGVRAGRRTYGHRFLSPAARSIKDARRYFSALKRANVLVDPQERRVRIASQARGLATKVAGRPVLDAALLDELVMSVEWPQALLGSFDREFLSLPQPVLATVMEHHQKYFPVENAKTNALLPHFIAVRDGDTRHLSAIREGHEWVLRARLADARFFFDQDRRQPLEAYVAKLSGLSFHEKLGSMTDKTNRLVSLADYLAVTLVLDGRTSEALRRAAFLCKADLVTQVVGEFPELQGVIGGIYAEMDGELAEVARAIAEHYKPAGADDTPPSTQAGALLALADKVDTLTGSIGAGLVPTGSQDPYGLRRAAQGIVDIILNHRLKISLRSFVARTAEGYGRRVEQAAEETVEFLRQRLRASLVDRGLRYDLVDAALAVSGDDLLAAAARAETLGAWASKREFVRLYVAYDRASRILTGTVNGRVDPQRFEDDSERALHETVRKVKPPVEGAAAEGNFTKALDGLLSLAGPVDRLFEAVMIMAPDEGVKANRMALLKQVVDVFRNVADFSKVVMSEEEKFGVR